MKGSQSDVSSGVRRVLIVAATTGYQTRAFEEASERLDVQLVYATDRCRELDDPWGDRAVPIRFHEEPRAVDAIVEAARERPFHGVLAVGDRPTVIAGLAAERLGLPAHAPDACRASRDKRATRQALRAAGLPVPWFHVLPLDIDPASAVAAVEFPCVVKAPALSGSRGVIRANDPRGLGQAIARLQRLLTSRDVRALRDPANAGLLVEGFIEGREFALEGVLTRGRLQTLAIFDKPDPLDGPFFEETIYVTPPDVGAATGAAIEGAIAAAAAGLGLTQGPIHAECRVNARGVYVLEVAARPIGGLCARALRFARDTADRATIALEELLLRHALGEDVAGWRRETHASGVMMIPVPRGGYLKDVTGIERAGAVTGIEDVVITAKRDQLLVPLPEGASYLGFLFARAPAPSKVVAALRSAHGRLAFRIDPAYPFVRSGT
jgi:biotin carboxylase